MPLILVRVAPLYRRPIIFQFHFPAGAFSGREADSLPNRISGGQKLQHPICQLHIVSGISPLNPVFRPYRHLSRLPPTGRSRAYSS